MLRVARWVVAGVAVCGGVTLVGCQSSSQAAGGSGHAVVCDRCGMEVRRPYTVPGYEGPRRMGYLTTTTPECSSCRAAQEAYQATGTFEPGCKTCGGTMRVAQGR